MNRLIYRRGRSNSPRETRWSGALPNGQRWQRERAASADAQRYRGYTHAAALMASLALIGCAGDMNNAKDDEANTGTKESALELSTAEWEAEPSATLDGVLNNFTPIPGHPGYVITEVKGEDGWFVLNTETQELTPVAGTEGLRAPTLDDLDKDGEHPAFGIDGSQLFSGTFNFDPTKPSFEKGEVVHDSFFLEVTGNMLVTPNGVLLNKGDDTGVLIDVTTGLPTPVEVIGAPGIVGSIKVVVADGENNLIVNSIDPETETIKVYTASYDSAAQEITVGDEIVTPCTSIEDASEYETAILPDGTLISNCDSVSGIQIYTLKSGSTTGTDGTDGTGEGTDGTGEGTEGTGEGTEGTGEGTDGTGEGTEGTGEGTEGTGEGTGEGTDGTGEGTEGTGEGTEGTGEGTEGTGEGTDGTGEGTDGTGEGTDGTGEGTDGTGEGTDGTGEGTDGTGEGTDGTGEGTGTEQPSDNPCEEITNLTAGCTKEAVGETCEIGGRGENDSGDCTLNTSDGDFVAAPNTSGDVRIDYNESAHPDPEQTGSMVPTVRLPEEGTTFSVNELTGPMRITGRDVDALVTGPCMAELGRGLNNKKVEVDGVWIQNTGTEDAIIYIGDKKVVLPPGGEAKFFTTNEEIEIPPGVDFGGSEDTGNNDNSVIEVNDDPDPTGGCNATNSPGGGAVIALAMFTAMAVRKWITRPFKPKKA